MKPNNAQQNSRSELGRLLQENFGLGPLELPPRLHELVERLDAPESAPTVIQSERKS
jgi:hypothetical protein